MAATQERDQRERQRREATVREEEELQKAIAASQMDFEKVRSHTSDMR
jgi:hypothetical protein